MEIIVITLFPEMFTALDYGITGRAIKNNLLKVSYLNPREFTHDKHQTVDDQPYGGGPGMVMKFEPLNQAINKAKTLLNAPAHTIYLSPQGKRLDQSGINALISRLRLILIAGRYEGVDERLLSTDVDAELSIGDYVLSGGEYAALVIIDAIARLLPGALGDATSAVQDSFYHGLLDYPHYTRPDAIEHQRVPKVLLSGDHQQIANWRLKQALGRTWLRRPDLLAKQSLTELERQLLDEFIKELHNAEISHGN